MSQLPSALPQISDSEWIVMRVLWERGDLSTGDVNEVLGETTDWNPRTIQTLIRRLHKKAALEVTSKNGREFVYRSIVAEGDCEQAACQSFLGRIFDGKLTPFVANLVENQMVPQEDIDELKRLLDQASQNQKEEGIS